MPAVVGMPTEIVFKNPPQVICELGRGAYGVVEKMKHKQTDTIIAVKRITPTANILEQKRALMDMDIAMRSSDCPYTVQFYGAMFRLGDEQE